MIGFALVIGIVIGVIMLHLEPKQGAEPLMRGDGGIGWAAPVGQEAYDVGDRRLLWGWTGRTQRYSMRHVYW